MSSFLLQFRELDPKTGVIPATFQGLAGIGARARAMLENRTAEQIGQAASAVDWAIDEQVRDWEEEERARVGDEVFSRSSYGFRDDLVSALQQYFNSYGVDIDPELTHCGWEDYEYFAALSLWLLADSVTWIKQRPLTGRSVYADGRVELVIPPHSSSAQK